MKKIVLLCLFLFSCSQDTLNWSSENINEFLTHSRNKNLMVYFYADW